MWLFFVESKSLLHKLTTYFEQTLINFYNFINHTFGLLKTAFEKKMYFSQNF